MLATPNSKFESLPPRDFGTDIGIDTTVWDSKSAEVNDLLLPTDETEPPETTRDRIIKGFRLGDPNMPFTYEIADALRRASRTIGVGGGRIPRSRFLH